MKLPAAIGISAALALIGCRQEAQPSQSLVGATKRPAASELDKETIILARRGGKDATDLLNIEIRPTNEVVTAHYRGLEPAPIAKESFSVPGQDAERMRLALWRLRPDHDATVQEAIPIGCRFRYDAGIIWTVGYFRKEDRMTRNFRLPAAGECDTAAYKEAQILIKTILDTLPQSKVVEQFPPLSGAWP